MDDLIREIIEAFEMARVEWEEGKKDDNFLRWLFENRNYPSGHSIAGGIFAEKLTPVLEKHVKPDRLETIKALLEKLEKQYGKHIWITFFYDESGSVSNQKDGGNEVLLKGFGPNCQAKTPEDAIRSLLKPACNEDTFSDCVARIDNIDPAEFEKFTIECEGKRYALRPVE